MAAYKNKETLSHIFFIRSIALMRITYVLGAYLCFVASNAAAVDSETWHYGLDNVGNITSSGTDSQNPTHNYGYDGVYRLTDETNPSNSDQYSYDANSNRTSFTRDGSSTSYQIDSSSNRLTLVGSDPRTYDNKGNIKSDHNGSRTFTYNQAGRLTQVHENSQLLATYTYNAYGQRTMKTTQSSTTYYLYGKGGRLLGEYDDTGQSIKEYVHLGGEPIAQLEASNITYLHNDHLATPRKATNEAGNVVWKWDSEAFGNKQPESSSTTVNLRFPGQYHDSETGLNYNHFRYYDPQTGRYITSDPIGVFGGFNTYGYVLNNPLKYKDPLGLEVTVVCRPINVWGISGTGLVHCSVFVWHWEDDGCGGKVKVIDAQYSLAGGQSPQTDPTLPTYSDDRDAWNNPGGDNDHYDIPPPPGMGQSDFDDAVQDSGDNYNSGEPYDSTFGPNSNTATDNIIEGAGGTMPDIPGAIQQNYGEPIDTTLAP